MKNNPIRHELYSACESILSLRVLVDHPEGFFVAEYWHDVMFHFFFDDSLLASDPDRYMGDVLHTDSEKRDVIDLTTTLDAIATDVGVNTSFPSWVKHPKWIQLESCAVRLIASILKFS